MIEVALPGTGGMMPLPGRWLSCLAVRSGGHGVLFDCGEGTQVALKEIRWGFRDIDVLAITHLHADHLAGLVGMLLMFANSGRTEELRIYGPPGLAAVVAGQRLLARVLPYPVEVIELWPGEGFTVGQLRATTALGVHHGTCLAYRLDLARQRRFYPERARELGVPVAQWRGLQAGQPVNVGGRTVAPDSVLGEERPGLALAFVTDTRPTTELARLASGVDLLVCEGTFGASADQPRAIETRHMTFAEAATLARSAGAARLVLTHFSAALTDPDAHGAEARAIFAPTTVGHDGLRVTLRFPPDEAPAQLPTI